MPTPVISLHDTRIAFSGKTDAQLKNSLFLFRILHRPWLVKLLTGSVKIAMKLSLPVNGLVRKTIFRQFCGGESLAESRNVVDDLNKRHVGSILDYSVEAKERNEDFENTLGEIRRIIDEARSNPAIPYTSVKLTGLISSEILEFLSEGKKADPDRAEAIRKSVSRFYDLCYYAYVSKVPLYVDAEESWMQPAIDSLTEEMMRKYNMESAIVQTTLQMYRHDRIAYLEKLIAEARQGGYKIGVKLVRGAYLEKENERAQRMNYPSPMQKCKEDTDRDFNLAVSICLDNIDIVSVCCGTHNEESTLFLTAEMKKRGIDPGDKRICFSQLYGMSDNITFNLAEAGYCVTKYLPYGPVKSVLPYLIRRAEENTAIAGQMGREYSLLDGEMRRRHAIKN